MNQTKFLVVPHDQNSKRENKQINRQNPQLETNQGQNPFHTIKETRIDTAWSQQLSKS